MSRAVKSRRLRVRFRARRSRFGFARRLFSTSQVRAQLLCQSCSFLSIGCVCHSPMTIGLYSGFSSARRRVIARALSRESRGSSVVERIIGNDEVGSSILPRGTSANPYKHDSFYLFKCHFTVAFHIVNSSHFRDCRICWENPCEMFGQPVGVSVLDKAESARAAIPYPIMPFADGAFNVEIALSAKPCPHPSQINRFFASDQ